MNTQLNIQAQPTIAPIVFPVRTVDGTPDATRGSFKDLPFIDQGTSASGALHWDEIVLGQFLSALTLGTVSSRSVGQIRLGLMILPLEIKIGTGERVTLVAASEHSAEDFVRDIQLALAEGAYLDARRLSAEGARRFPEHVLLAKYARVLAPPRVIRKEVAKKTDLRLNRDWIMQNGDAYRGKWIALRNGELRGAADSLRALFEGLNGDKDVFVTKVF